MSALKIQSKNLLDIRIVVNSLNFVFHIRFSKSKYKIISFIFHFVSDQQYEMALWIHRLMLL